MSRALPLLLLLSGCWLTGGELRDKIVLEEREAPGPIDISAVEPGWGPTSGGTDVTITATPLADDVQVWFADQQATVLDVDDDQVVVRSPAVDGPGTVDLHLEWGAKEGSWRGAFEYFPDATGLYGAIGTVAWIDVVGSLESDVSDVGFAWMNFIEPSPHGYDAMWAPDLDLCSSTWQYPGAIDEQSGAGEVVLSTQGATRVTLDWEPSTESFETELAAGQYTTRTTYDLEPVQGVGGWPAISVKGLARTPDTHAVLEPPIADGDAPTVSRFATDLEWTTPGHADYAVIRLVLWNNNLFFPEVQERVSCLVRDDGEFRVPSDVWQSDLDEFHEVDVYLGRVDESDAVLPHDNSSSGVAGAWWVVGVVEFQTF